MNEKKAPLQGAIAVCKTHGPEESIDDVVTPVTHAIAVSFLVILFGAKTHFGRAAEAAHCRAKGRSGTG